MANLVNMHGAKNSLSPLDKRAAAGEKITRVPTGNAKIPWDCYKDQIEMTADFDAPIEEFQKYA